MSITKQVSIHGRKLFLTNKDRLASRGYVAGGLDKPNLVYHAPDTVSLFDDFLTSLAGLGAGSDTGTTPIAINVLDTGTAGLHFLARCTDTGVKSANINGTNGVHRITSSQSITTVTPAASSRTIVGKQLAWKMDQGPAPTSGERAADNEVRFAARVKASTYPHKTDGAQAGRIGIFVGFTDTVAHEVPIHDTGVTGDSGASAVSTASDAVGFLWSTDGDTGWRGVGVSSGSGGANDSGDQRRLLTTTKPTANTWTVLEMVHRRTAGDTGGHVTFYIDGAEKGRIDSPVAQGVGLAPVVSFYDTGGVATFDIDYIGVSATRDTGV